jgi:hypothetical protein
VTSCLSFELPGFSHAGRDEIPGYIVGFLKNRSRQRKSISVKSTHLRQQQAEYRGMQGY